MTKSRIEWTDEVWNPMTGCTKVSEGCRNCYAERYAIRFWGERKFGEIKLHPERLDNPLHWNRPRRVFVDSMGDLFHEKIPTYFIYAVWMKMRQAKKHTFLILTKRPQRMSKIRLPIYENIWLGVSVENQKTVDERIPYLLENPAAVRFVSYEPALEYINFLNLVCRNPVALPTQSKNELIQWFICGGETGPGARPMHPDWVRAARDQCQAAGVKFFFKQWGEWIPWEPESQPPFWKSQNGQFKDAHWFMPDFMDTYTEKHCDDGLLWACGSGIGHAIFEKVGKRKAGRMLDGRTWNEYPIK